VLRDILDVLVDGCQQATRLRIDGRSTAPGTVPGWLESIASFDVSLAGTSTLELESAPFADARTRGLPRADALAGLDLHKTCLPSGEAVRGIATEQVDLAELASLFGKQALVSGIAKFRPSRSVLRIEAELVQPVTGDVRVFSHVPKPLSLDMRALRVPQGPTTGVAAIIGKWPGDESDEEILRALEELS
jgi:hypothetical protein